MPFPPNAGQPARPPMPAGPGAAPPAAAPQQAQAVASAFHNQVLQRLRTLSPPEKQTLIAGISPQVAVVLKKILPELADIIDKVAPQPQAAPEAAPMTQGPAADAEMQQMEGEAAPPAGPRPPFPPRKPATGLNRY
jgi:hypothetical protein